MMKLPPTKPSAAGVFYMRLAIVLVLSCLASFLMGAMVTLSPSMCWVAAEQQECLRQLGQLLPESGALGARREGGPGPRWEAPLELAGVSGGGNVSGVSFGRNPFVPGPLSAPRLPVLAYLIGGSANDTLRMMRLLQAVYHPRNEYILHLEEAAPSSERLRLMYALQQEPLFQRFKNVFLVPDAILVSYRGPSMIAVTLQAMSLALKRRPDFDWFINLSAGDYPLMTQDDLLYVLAHVPRDVNFVHHSESVRRIVDSRVRSLVVDSALSNHRKGWTYVEGTKRGVPDRFLVFKGSAWMVLTRSFVEYTVSGWESLPRLALMYFANFVSAPESYFQTVVCNAGAFQDTVVNSDLHFIEWPRRNKSSHPMDLTEAQWPRFVASGAPFARKFSRDEPVLDRIDAELLRRTPGRMAWGGWCKGAEPQVSSGALTAAFRDPCAEAGRTSRLRLTAGHKRLMQLMAEEFDKSRLAEVQCVDQLKFKVTGAMQAARTTKT